MSHVGPIEAAPQVEAPALEAPAVGTAQENPNFLDAVRARLGIHGPASLARRFLLASLTVLVAGGLSIGLWVGDQLERGIIDRTASITALYVGSFIEPHLASLATGEWLTDQDKSELDSLLTGTEFAQKIVVLKVWRPDGVIMYSPDRSLIGQQFPVDADLAASLAGEVTADMSSLDEVENASERDRFDRLLEMYIPVRESGSDRIIAAAEFYQLPTEIDQEVADARLRSWLVVAAAVIVAYLLLYGIVRQGNDTIVRQQTALQTQVSELSTLLAQNEQLRGRVRTAAERTTTLSERTLRRISSDLHDGPGQMLALAMLRLDHLRSRSGTGKQPSAGSQGADETADAPRAALTDDTAADTEFNDLRGALDDALRDMRTIAAGLRLPELDGLSTSDAARRAVDDHARRTGTAVDLTFDGKATDAPLPAKIAMFRAIQELLSNATRDGGGHDVSVRIANDGRWLRLTVSDRGPGFDAGKVGAEGHLGLAGIREQAELLGGTFEVGRPPGPDDTIARSDESSAGATVTVSWPL